MSDPTLDGLNTCGCGQETPAERANRPGLPAIRYRLGTYGTFMTQLVAQITRQTIPGGPTLQALKTRQLDDSAIALLDAWAIVADVLTFYQERIANENYLRTATERRSVLELARAIGYELNPGVAASTYLAFTVATTPGSPEVVTIPQGVQVLSIPGQGELPQTFETAQAFTARPEWNSLRPRLTQPQDLAFKGDQLYLWTADADLAPLLAEAKAINSSELHFLGALPQPVPAQVTALPIQKIYLAGTRKTFKVGQRILFVGSKPNGSTGTLIQAIQRVSQQPADDLTLVEFALVPQRIPPLQPSADRFVVSKIVPTAIAFNTQQITKTVLAKPIREQTLQALFTLNRWSPKAFVAEAAKPPPPSPPPGNQGVFIFEQPVNCFGHNAPRYETLPKPAESRGSDPYPASWDSGAGRTVWQNSQGYSYSALANHGLDLYLERTLPEISLNSWVLLENSDGKQQTFQVEGTGETSLVDYGISGKSTGLKLRKAISTDDSQSTDFRVRRTTVYAQSERLTLAALPIESPLQEIDLTVSSAPVGTRSLELETLVIGFQIGQSVLIQGKRSDAPQVTATEAAVLAEIVHEGTNTTLHFQNRLQYRYLRDSVVLYGNTIAATHGETISEVLGSGDGAKTYQTFKLKKPPLTYTSANTPSGAQSSLSVRVNNILWEESRAFYGLSPAAERYIVRIEDDGTTQVTFGDSIQGSRLPTGTENVSALYRSGIGPAGEVPADSLTLLKTRPLGVQTVTNLLPATGAEAPERLETARTSAPLTVLTLDRIVSRQDYADFAQAFAGIGKAQAVEIWDGFTTQIQITIAAANGEPVSVSSQTYQNLQQAINNLRDPGPPFAVASFEPRSFNLSAKLRLDERYVREAVIDQVKTVLLEAFSFARRDFGQGVSAAEAIALIQPVAGVIAVDLDTLHRTDKPTKLSSYVGAAIAQWNPNQSPPQVTPAELLLINPVGIALEVNPS